MPEKPEDAPCPALRIEYGAKTQYIDKQEQEQILSTKYKTKIQQIVKTFLLYARAFYAAMLTAPNEFQKNKINQQLTLQGK